MLWAAQFLAYSYTHSLAHNITRRTTCTTYLLILPFSHTVQHPSPFCLFSLLAVLHLSSFHLPRVLPSSSSPAVLHPSWFRLPRLLYCILPPSSFCLSHLLYYVSPLSTILIYCTPSHLPLPFSPNAPHPSSFRLPYLLNFNPSFWRLHLLYYILLSFAFLTYSTNSHTYFYLPCLLYYTPHLLLTFLLGSPTRCLVQDTPISACMQQLTQRQLLAAVYNHLFHATCTPLVHAHHRITHGVTGWWQIGCGDVCV